MPEKVPRRISEFRVDFIFWVFTIRILHSILLYVPPEIPRNAMILQDLLLTTTWIRT